MTRLSHSSGIGRRMLMSTISFPIAYLDEHSLDYFRWRERVERAAAKNASSQAARRVHQELAQSYAELTRRG